MKIYFAKSLSKLASNEVDVSLKKYDNSYEYKNITIRIFLTLETEVSDKVLNRYLEKFDRKINLDLKVSVLSEDDLKILKLIKILLSNDEKVILENLVNKNNIDSFLNYTKNETIVLCTEKEYSVFYKKYKEDITIIDENDAFYYEIEDMSKEKYNEKNSKKITWGLFSNSESIQRIIFLRMIYIFMVCFAMCVCSISVSQISTINYKKDYVIIEKVQGCSDNLEYMKNLSPNFQCDKKESYKELTYFDAQKLLEKEDVLFVVGKKKVSNQLLERYNEKIIKDTCTSEELLYRYNKDQTFRNEDILKSIEDVLNTKQKEIKCYYDEIVQYIYVKIDNETLITIIDQEESFDEVAIKVSSGKEMDVSKKVITDFPNNKVTSQQSTIFFAFQINAEKIIIIVLFTILISLFFRSKLIQQETKLIREVKQMVNLIDSYDKKSYVNKQLSKVYGIMNLLIYVIFFILVFVVGKIVYEFEIFLLQFLLVVMVFENKKVFYK